MGSLRRLKFTSPGGTRDGQFLLFWSRRFYWKGDAQDRVRVSMRFECRIWCQVGILRKTRRKSR